MKCWICEEEAISREHLLKKSDLKSAFGHISQKQPLYYSNDSFRNVPIGSLKSERFTSPPILCAFCNTTRTQAHDRDWEKFSITLRSKLNDLHSLESVRANSIFMADTRQHMLNIHLYFVKLFGCRVSVDRIPIDLAGFSNALLNKRAHPNVYIGLWKIQPRVGISEILADLSDNGDCVFASWMYEIEHLAVNIMFAVPGEKRSGLVKAWHPSFGAKRLFIHDSTNSTPQS
jgi:hypothetical protein